MPGSASGRHEEELESLAAELSAIAERLADLSMQVLREAISAGARSRPPLERQLTRARGAVERAVGLLSSLGEAGADDE